MKGLSISVLLALLCGCGEDVPGRRFELEGDVVSVDADAGTVTVDHREIEGFMPAMTMPFPLGDRWAFSKLQPKDGISAILVVRGEEYWLEGIVISRTNPSPDGGAPRVVPAPGTEVPDVELVNQSGDWIRISSYHGRALALTFVYTRCPLVEYCPRMTHQFRALEAELKTKPALYAGTHLLTISFDPDFDTPERLKGYAAQYGLVNEESFAHWEFATTAPASLAALTTFFGLELTMDGDQIAHNLVTALVGPDGRLLRVYRGTDWSVEDVLSAIEGLEGLEVTGLPSGP